MKTEIELAKQAGWEYADDDRGFEPLWRFAALVCADAIADEREACAKVCEQSDEEGEGPDLWDWHSKDYAAAIRARSSHEDRN